MTSLPIYWNEGDPFSDLGNANAQMPWVRQTLERRYQVVPIDALAGEEQASPLAGLDALAIIQPRGISPAGNVALDEWVREGGRLFLALDPMLSGEYDVAIGDPRHPIVSTLVPPVLDRWGLGLSFDEMQDDDPRLVYWDDLAMPVVMAGVLSVLPDGDREERASCMITSSGVITYCQLGKGQITVLADVALFEPREGNTDAETALLTLFEKALN